MDQTQRKAEIRQEGARVRRKTLALLDLVPEAFLKVRLHDFYSPIGWHFGHIGMTEEFWACTQALGRSAMNDALSFLFANTPENPKNNRVYLPSREEIRGYLEETRCRALDALEAADLDTDAPLLADGYAWEFALQHECQHQETIAELLQLIHQHQGEFERISDGRLSLENTPWSEETIAISGGTFRMGSNDRHGYDNEKREHLVEVAPFELDRYPVTVRQWMQFMRDGGYERSELWTPEGWAWRQAWDVLRPEYWFPPLPDGTYRYAGPLGVRSLTWAEPVSSLSWFEADAYARWAGKRLPTEAEWEYAAAFDPATGRSRQFPWGQEPPTAAHAHCEQQAIFHFDARASRQWRGFSVGSTPEGASALNVEAMAGGVWEWTSTPFLPYPGFEAFPYDGYSKEHMDGRHYVCRGGSWATDRRILRCSFRNWYVPTYRQGFLGVRCAR
ncbi:MAG TPA: SUMF1/EgtB/PvdO family nonheme iron enzyme [Chthonomonadaceae bacterium]|nr:SUMF1/EgtB/PvdO family nonheme iron enzyme [Chthonomonadaceae bacterium]